MKPIDFARRSPSLLDPSTFVFLNKSGELSEVGWDGPQREKLWRYNQHYFDDLNAVDAGFRTEWHRELLKSWVVQNPPGVGTGWEPYPTSLRIVNWVKWQVSGQSLSEGLLQCLAVQARWLMKRIEWHILGNHLFSNAKALIFSGLFFEGAEADRWLKTGLDIVAEQLPVQVLPDGGNFELSPMYHAIFIEDLLDLINLAMTYQNLISKNTISDWRCHAEKMLRWLKMMTHPDGEIAFFNDSAIGIAPSLNELIGYSNKLGVNTDLEENRLAGVELSHLKDSGYIRLYSHDLAAILDVAPVGPDYLPGHAHADTLSFEISIFGKRVIVNGGTSQYGDGPIRFYERGTGAHSTVQVNYEDSSEIWSGFRVARRAYPFNLEIKQSKNYISVSCSHDGYKRLVGRPVHRRTWIASHGKLTIKDEVFGKFDSAISRFYFHPDVRITQSDESIWVLALEGVERKVVIKVIRGQGQIEQGFYCPEFGLRLKTLCLAVNFYLEREVAIEIICDKNESY